MTIVTTPSRSILKVPPIGICVLVLQRLYNTSMRPVVALPLQAMRPLQSIAKMSKDLPVSMDVLGRICKALDVNIGDIVDYVDDDTSTD